MAYTRIQAFAIARAIKAASKSSGKVYVFGKCLHNLGMDIDIIVEAPAPLFEQYQRECHESGVAAIIRGVYDPHDLFWSYFSPTEPRSESALRLIGVERDQILTTDGMDMLRRDLDVICLPVGWIASPLREQIQQDMSANWKCDQAFMENLSRSAILVE